MSGQKFIFERKDGIGRVTINRPEQMNSLNRAFLGELGRILDESENDDDIRVLVLTGRGKAFCAGADIDEIRGFGSASAGYDFIQLAQRTFQRIETLGKPVVACINGLALGGGLELALACDFRIASVQAVFGLPEVKIGALPAAGGTTRLPRIIGLTRAVEMLMLGEPIGAEEALRLGLVGRVAPADKLLEVTTQVAVSLSRMPPLALKVIKKVVSSGLDSSLESGMALELQAAGFLFNTEDLKEGVAAFVQKRKPVFNGR